MILDRSSEMDKGQKENKKKKKDKQINKQQGMNVNVNLTAFFRKKKNLSNVRYMEHCVMTLNPLCVMDLRTGYGGDLLK